MSLPNVYSMFQHWAKQTVWIYSDPHFSDEDLECSIKNRPSDEEHIKMINSCVGRKDTLIILGDVGNIECVRRLRAGYKVLIMGNHDAGATKYRRQVVHKIFDQNKYTKEQATNEMKVLFPGWKISISEEWTFDFPFERWNVYADNMLFDEVYEGALIVGEKLILSHEPVNIPWMFNIHGHIHSARALGDRNHLNVCSDVVGYKPVNLNAFLKSSGSLAKIQSIHRITIDKAISRKNERRIFNFKN